MIGNLKMAAKAISRTGRSTIRYLLGTCVPSSKQNAAKVRVPRLQFDGYLHMYFKEFDYVYANDPNQKCKTGDVILIEELPEKLTRLITHQVIEIVHPLGDMIDPITKKSIVRQAYRDDIERETMLYGKKESAFDYSKAPPRGRLENIRDFSHKKMYLKYYDDPNDPQSDTV